MIPGLILALQMSEPHDEELAIRLQRRDPEAMRDLYDRFGRMAWSVIVAIVRDSAVAEEPLFEAHTFSIGDHAGGCKLPFVAIEW